MKHVLVLCTGNSCRSIMAEAILNAELGDRLKCFSSGVAASGTVNPMALDVIREIGLSTDGLYSKRIDELPKLNFDLVVTVCDHAKESCPVFPGGVKTMHLGMKDPAGGSMEDFYDTVKTICDELVPAVMDAIED